MVYRVIPSRHTNRGPYNLSKSAGSNVLYSLAKQSDDDTVRISWFAEQLRETNLGGSIAAAEALIGDEQQSSDSSHWQVSGESFHFGRFWST